MTIPKAGIIKRSNPNAARIANNKETIRMLGVAHFRMPFRGTTPITSTPAAGDTYVTITS
jgi:hypothetical protein